MTLVSSWNFKTWFLKRILLVFAFFLISVLVFLITSFKVVFSPLGSENNPLCVYRLSGNTVDNPDLGSIFF